MYFQSASRLYLCCLVRACGVAAAAPHPRAFASTSCATYRAGSSSYPILIFIVSGVERAAADEHAHRPFAPSQALLVFEQRRARAFRAHAVDGAAHVYVHEVARRGLVQELAAACHQVGVPAAHLHAETRFARVPPNKRPLAAVALQQIGRHRHLAHGDVRARVDARATERHVAHRGQRRDSAYPLKSGGGGKTPGRMESGPGLARAEVPLLACEILRLWYSPPVFVSCFLRLRRDARLASATRTLHRDAHRAEHGV